MVACSPTSPGSSPPPPSPWRPTMSKPESPEHLSKLLAKPNPAVIGTVGATGAPITVATWYLWEDGRILLNMDAGRRRLQHLRADPRVSLTVLDSESWYRHISL